MKLEHPQYKLAIWFGSIIVLRQMYVKVLHGHLEKKMKELSDKLILPVILDQEVKDEPES
jgi:hypothetical protein